MEFEAIAEALRGIPHTTQQRGRELYDFVRSERPSSMLELGFGHGVSTCYVAAAMQENGRGSITTIDLTVARDREPNLETLLDRTALKQFVRPIYVQTSYTWELMRILERTDVSDRPYDFCFIDGAHNWDTDGFAFYLVDQLLQPGSWILFDDLNWSYANSPTLKNADWVLKMPPDERETPQIAKVFDLLVRRHSGYGEFRSDGVWGWARKLPAKGNRRWFGR